MAEGIIMDFDVIKQKIIKTSDLLELCEDRTTKLTKTLRTCKDLKTKHETALSQINLLKLDNERLNYSLTTCKTRCSALEDCEAQLNTLQDKYNQTLIESQLNYQELEEKASMVGLSDMEIKKYESSIKKLEIKVQKLTVSKDQLQSEVDELQKKSLSINSELVTERSRVIELNKEKVQLNEEIDKLRSKKCICSNALDINLFEIECERLKSENERIVIENKKIVEQYETYKAQFRLNEDLQTRNEDLLNEIKILRTTIQTFETQSKVNANIENTKTDEINRLNNMIKTLQHDLKSRNCKIKFKNTATQFDSNDFEDFNHPYDDVDAIFKEMICPGLISPISSIEGMSEHIISSDYPNISAISNDEFRSPINNKIQILNESTPIVPQIIVTPPTPKDVIEKLEFNQLARRDTDFTKIRLLKQKRRERILRLKKQCKLKGLQKMAYKPIQKQSNCSDSTILQALKSFQKNNINFVISSNPPTSIKKDQIGPVIQEKISCETCVNATYFTAMESENLLGFSRCERIVVNTERNTNNSNSNEGLISKLLTGIKDLVDSKSQPSLQQRSSRRIMLKKPVAVPSEFNSETETEIERLFTSDVLKRNKLLLQQAKTELQMSKSSMEPSPPKLPKETLLISPLASSATTNSVGESPKAVVVAQPKKRGRPPAKVLPVKKQRGRMRKNVSKEFITSSESEFIPEVKVSPKKTVAREKSEFCDSGQDGSVRSDSGFSEKDSDKCVKIQVVQNISIDQFGGVQNLLRDNKSCESSSQPKQRQIQHKNTEVDLVGRLMENMSKNTSEMRLSKAIKPINLKKKVHVVIPDCPLSPDIPKQVGEEDLVPMKIIPTEAVNNLAASKLQVLFAKLMQFSHQEDVLIEVVREFHNQDTDYIAEVILKRVSVDITQKADAKHAPSPVLTDTQRVLLGFIVRLEKEGHPELSGKFLQLAEKTLFCNSTCTLEIVQPITRLYTALCKMRYDMNRIRRFCVEAFYFMGDFAVPLFFTVLTMWGEILPKNDESTDFSMAKVLVQLVFLKVCNLPGYNLIPLRELLSKFFGYPKERLSCNDVFNDILAHYLSNPASRLSDLILMVFCKSKPPKWVYDKLKSNVMPLFDKIPEENVNLKATLIILIGNICSCFQYKSEEDSDVAKQVTAWLRGLNNDSTSNIVKRSIFLAISRLPKRPKGFSTKPKQSQENDVNNQQIKTVNVNNNCDKSS